MYANTQETVPKGLSSRLVQGLDAESLVTRRGRLTNTSVLCNAVSVYRFSNFPEAILRT